MIQRRLRPGQFFIGRNEPEGWISSSLELFEGLSRRELTNVDSYFTTIDAEAGSQLGRRGEQCRYFGVVLEGQVGMSFHETPVGFLTPGCFYGAVALLDPSGDRRRRGTATAMTDSTLAIANPREFVSLLYRFPLLATRIQAMAQLRREFVVRAETAQRDTEAPVDYPVHILHDEVVG